LTIFKVSTISPSTILKIEGDHNSLRLVVPLPSKGLRAFTLPAGRIRYLIDNLKKDDPTILDVDIFDTNGDRLARSFDILRLIQGDWKLRINDKTYYVQVPTRGFRTMATNQENIERFRGWFSELAKTQDYLDYEVYLYKCQDWGLNQKQAYELCSELCRLGIIFRYEHNIELEKKIFLNPSNLTKLIRQVLNIDYATMSLDSRKELLNSLRKEYDILLSEHNKILKSAETTVSTMGWSLFVGLCCQWVLFARLTWWEYSWDEIEPVTYFTTAVEMILAGYAYYLLKRKEFAITDFSRNLVQRRYEALSRSQQLDTVKLKQLTTKVKELETLIQSEEQLVKL